VRLSAQSLFRRRRGQESSPIPGVSAQCLAILENPADHPADVLVAKKRATGVIRLQLFQIHGPARFGMGLSEGHAQIIDAPEEDQLTAFPAGEPTRCARDGPRSSFGGHCPVGPVTIR